MAEEKTTLRTVGRRKTAAARVRLTLGTGAIMINGKSLEIYFPLALLQETVVSPLSVVSKRDDFDVSVKVRGGGVHGQAGAVRHGIARALVTWNPEWRKALKAEGFLTRDPRAKERKKPGLYRARRGHQWRKR